MLHSDLGENERSASMVEGERSPYESGATMECLNNVKEKGKGVPEG